MSEAVPLETPTSNGRLRCLICPHACDLREGQAGRCGVRVRHGDHIDLTVYGRASGLVVDPIEKKPLYHVLPGSRVLSFGTPGCNLSCSYCQNWQLTTATPKARAGQKIQPQDLVRLAREQGCQSIAFTYNDPVIFFEYARDTAQACHEEGLLAVAVTAGYMQPHLHPDFFEHMDAVNVDLKSFQDSAYQRLCGGSLRPVLDTLGYVAQDPSTWLEVTTLLIPDVNDSDRELKDLCRWMVDNLGRNVPWHISAFHPDHRYRQGPPTSEASLERARQIGLDQGLQFVYLGNLGGGYPNHTSCSHCGQRLIHRQGYHIQTVTLTDEALCPACGCVLPGIYQDGSQAVLARVQGSQAGVPSEGGPKTKKGPRRGP